MSRKNPIQYVTLALKGMAMGAADVVPGVSGGTIAFITGIYEELITSISNVNMELFSVLKKDGIKGAWNHLNGTFLLVLFSGIIISIVTLAKGVTYLLDNHPVLIWSFFFGLIVASAWLIGKSIKQWTIPVITMLMIGAVTALFISSIQTVAHVEAGWYIFLSGAIAICAMILPGISGSFILVLMGSYHLILSAIKEKELMTIALFASGCLIGLLSFAKVLKFLFEKFKDLTIAVLTGFMIGSLYKVWPWKNLGELLWAHPEKVEKNVYKEMHVLPGDFNGDAQLWLAIACAVGGLLLVVILERFAPKEA